MRLCNFRLVFGAVMLAAFAPVSMYCSQRSLYIDSRAVTSGGGTSQSEPIRHFAEINWAEIRSWVAVGDSVSINLKRGSEWREELTVAASGTERAPIVIQPYGTGPKPVINGSTEFNGPGAIWQESQAKAGEYYLQPSPGITQPACIWVNGIAYQRGAPGSLGANAWGWGDQENFGQETLYLAFRPVDETTEGATIPQCLDLSHQSYVTVKQIELKQNGQVVGGSYTYHSATVELYQSSHVTLEDCDIHDSAGVKGNIYLTRSSYNTFERCTVRNHVDVDGNGYGTLIYMESSDQGESSHNTIRNCVIQGTKAALGDCIGNVGKWVNGRAYGGSYNVFEYNDISGPAANAIYNRTGTSDNIIRFNNIHNIRSISGKGGIAVQLRDQANRNKVYGNTVIDCQGPTMQSDGQNGGPGSADPTCSGNRFWNNTIYNGSTPGANGFHFFGHNVNLEVRNNIVVSNSGDLILISASSSDLTFDGIVLSNNRYYKTVSTGSEFIYRGVNYEQLESVRAAMQKDGKTNEGGSSYGDPVFVSSRPADRKDLSLDSHSPCIGAGFLITEVDAPQACDSPDIGAMPYNDTSGLPPSALRLEAWLSLPFLRRSRL